MSILLANVSCVAVHGRAILIEGPPGSGKSSLALALIDRGGMLVGDDGIQIEQYDGHPHALPPPNIAGKLDIRDVGVVEVSVTQAPIALILTLEENPPRFPLDLFVRNIEGTDIPRLAFRSGDALQAIRAEYALEKYGLPIHSSLFTLTP